MNFLSLSYFIFYFIFPTTKTRETLFSRRMLRRGCPLALGSITREVDAFSLSLRQPTHTHSTHTHTHNSGFIITNFLIFIYKFSCTYNKTKTTVLYQQLYSTKSIKKNLKKTIFFCYNYTLVHTRIYPFRDSRARVVLFCYYVLHSQSQLLLLLLISFKQFLFLTQ